MQPPSENPERRLVGLPIHGGTVVAKVCLLNEYRHSNLPVYRVNGEGVAAEKERVRRAIGLAGRQLEALVREVAQRIGTAEAQIFQAQKAILEDASLASQIFEDLQRTGLNAETVVTRVLNGYESRLTEVDSEYLQERATDIGEIRRRLLDELAQMNPALQCGQQEHCQQGRDRIVVVEQLTAGLMVEVDTQGTVGFLAERGGPTSHAAILARGLGVPVVSGLPGIRSRLSCGTELMLDGTSGEVVIWPTPQTVARAQAKQRQAAGLAAPHEPIDGLTVLANISRAADLEEALAQKAEGIGLYRTELELLAAGRILSEEEQYQRYAAVVKALAGRPACFRLLDLGGDKGGKLFRLPQEDNPALGIRGARLLLQRPDLLRPQARALARASLIGPVDVLYPMIVDVEQFLELKRRFEEAIADLPRGMLRHGVMFEIPSACLEARALLEVADFGSVGTNDLVQYLFAVDRNNESAASQEYPRRVVFWSVLERIGAAARETGRSVSVCGEVAGNAEFLPRLLRCGLTTLSVSPKFISALRMAAAET